MAYVKFAQAGQVAKLTVSVGIVHLGESLAIGPQREAGLIQQPGNGMGSQPNPLTTQGLGKFPQRAVRPQQPGDGVARRRILKQTRQGLHDPGTVISTRLRPPP